jgi:hypothetical protein
MTIGIFLLINLTRMTNLIISQIEDFDKLDLKIPPNQVS